MNSYCKYSLPRKPRNCKKCKYGEKIDEIGICILEELNKYNC